MAFTPFTFVNSINANSSYGAALSNFLGPDGSTFGGSTVTASVLASQVLPTLSASGFVQGLVITEATSEFTAQTALYPTGFTDPPSSIFSGAGFLSLGGTATTAAFVATDAASEGGTYIYVRDASGNWTLEQVLLSGNPNCTGVAVAENWCAVVTSGTTVNIFSRSGSTWTQVQTITPTVGGSDEFGTAFAMTTEWLFIGAYAQSSNAGAIYVFQNQSGTWVQTQKITQSAGDFLGYSLSSDGTTLVAGAIGNGAGKAYVYTLVASTWTLQTTLTSSDGVTGDQFGAAVNVNSNLIAVGANRATVSALSEAGKAYIFTGGGASWTQQQILTSQSPAANANYGNSVSVLSAATAWVAVGEPRITISQSGLVYFYDSVGIDPPTVEASQLVFYGVRRIKKGPGTKAHSDPAPSSYPYYEKPFQIQKTFSITTAYNSALGLLAQVQRVMTDISDYDFELRHMVKYCTDGAGVPLTVASPFAVLLYDSVYVARMNYPIIAEFLFDNIGLNGRNFWPSPPILYEVNTHIVLDIFTLLDSSTVTLPVTVNILFDGVRRIPCL